MQIPSLKLRIYKFHNWAASYTLIYPDATIFSMVVPLSSVICIYSYIVLICCSLEYLDGFTLCTYDGTYLGWPEGSTVVSFWVVLFYVVLLCAVLFRDSLCYFLFSSLKLRCSEFLLLHKLVSLLNNFHNILFCLTKFDTTCQVIRYFFCTIVLGSIQSLRSSLSRCIFKLVNLLGVASFRIIFSMRSCKSITWNFFIFLRQFCSIILP